MKRKLAIMALAAAMVVSNAAAPMASMTVCAAENDEIGGILDDMFGGDKPQPDENAPGSSTGGGIEPGGDLGGWKPSEEAPVQDDSDHSHDTGNSGSTSTGNSGSTGSSSNSGSSNSSTSTGSSASAGSSASTDTFVQVVDPATGNTVTVVEQAGTTVAVPVTDEATLAVLPEAMVVTAPSGLSFVHALDTSRMMYSVWGGGLQVNAFMIVDAAGAPVVMQDVAIVTAPDGKSYVNVTIDPAITGASVFAANEQKVAFAKHYGIDGVMINGVLADTFLAIAE